MKNKIYTYFDVLNQHSIISATNRKGEIKYVNERFCEISKYEEEELIGAPHNIISSGHHSRDYFKNLWRTIGRGNVWHGDILNLAKDGSHYWVATTIVPIMEHGKVKEYFSVRIEKTEEKRLEEEKKLNESRYTELFNHISEGVVVMKKVDDQFIVTDFNEGAEQLDKRPKQSVLGKPVAEIYPSAEVKKFDAYLQEAFETGHAHFPILSYQDEKINSWRKGYFYKLPNDEVVCVYNDITEEIIQLEQLKKYNEKLEEIAFKASHELRSPVASILGLMQLIDFSDLSDGNRMALEHMKSSVEKLDYIVRDAVKVTYDTEEGKKLFNKLSDLKQKIEYVS